MSGASEVRAGGAFIEIGGKDGKLEKALANAKKKLNKFGKDVAKFGLAMQGLATAILGPMAAATKVFYTYGDNVAKAAKRLNVAVEWFQQMGFAAELAGTDINSMELGLKFMQRALVDAAKGGQETIDMLNILGLNAQDLMSMKPEDQFIAIGTAIKNIQNPALKTAMAMKFFGRAGTMLLPLVNDIGDTLDRAKHEAELLGVVLSSRASADAEELNDQVGRVTAGLKGFALTIGAQLAPILIDLANDVLKVIVVVRQFLDQHPELTQAVFRIAGAVFLAGSALVFLGTAIVIATSAAGPMLLALTLVVGALGMLITGMMDIDTGLSRVINSFTVFGATLHQWMQRLSLLIMSIWDTLVAYTWKAMNGIFQAYTWMIQKAMEAANKLSGKIVSQKTIDSFKKMREDAGKNLSARASDRMQQRNADLDALAEYNASTIPQENVGKKSFTEMAKGLKDQIMGFWNKDYSDLFGKVPKTQINVPTMPDTPATPTTGVVGTFGGASLRENMGVLGGSVDQQQLDTLKGMAGTLKNIEKNTEDGGATYE